MFEEAAIIMLSRQIHIGLLCGLGSAAQPAVAAQLAVAGRLRTRIGVSPFDINIVNQRRLDLLRSIFDEDVNAR